MNLKKLGLTALIAGAAALGSASAATIDFTVDETPPVLSGPTGLGIGYTVSSTGGDITNSEGVTGSSCSSVLGLACIRDGFGIGDDEVSIGGLETVTVSFTSEVFIQSFSVLDLFRSADSKNFEVGEYSVDGGATYTSFGSIANEAIDAGLSGALVVNLVNVFTDSIIFRAPAISFSNDDVGVNDFALAGLEVVPVPGAAILLLSGLAGLGFAGRKKKA